MKQHRSSLHFFKYFSFLASIILIFICSLKGISQNSVASLSGNPANCGSGLVKAQSDFEGPGVYDGLGSYVAASSLSLPLQGVCDCSNAGFPTSYFALYFEDCIFQTGKGFDDPLLGLERRSTMCRAFREISSFLIPNVNPCSGKTGMVNIQVKRSDIDNQNLPNNVAGRSGAFYMHEKMGINDGLPWILINSGEEPSGYSNSYHGFTQINFSPNSNFVWYTGEDPIPAGSSEHDLYTECIHQILHILGFSTYVNPGGTGNYLGSTIGGFTRWDSHLQMFNDVNGNIADGTPVVINNPAPSLNWALNTPPIGFPDDLFGSCNDPVPNGPDMVFDANGSYYPVFTGQAPNSIAFSHLQTNCDGVSTPSFVMHPALEPGVRLEITDPEYDILCTLGYNVSNCDCAVGGVDDKKEGCNGVDLSVPICSTYTFEAADILANDPNATSIQFMTLVDQLSGTLVSSGNSFVFTPAKLGLIALEYVPMGCNGKTGNKTFIFINVVNGPGCLTTCDGNTLGCANPIGGLFCITASCTPPSNSCNLICNPGICGTIFSDQEEDTIGELSPVNPEPPIINLPDWIRTRQDPDLGLFAGDGTIRLRGGGPYGGKFWEEGVMTYVPLSANTNYLYAVNLLRSDGYIGSTQNHVVSQLLQGDFLLPQYNPTQPTPPIYTGTTPQIINDQVINLSNDNIRAGSCFQTSNAGHNALEILISDDGDYMHVFMDDVELIEDKFSAGEDRSTQCNVPVTLGQEFCMLHNVEMEYTWKEKNTNTVIAKYTVLNDMVTAFSGANFNAMTHQVVVSLQQTTTYVLERKIINFGGLSQSFTLCGTLDEVTVFVPASPADALFSWLPVTCNNINFISVTQGTGVVHFWDFGDTGSGAANSSTDPNPTHLFAVNGYYTVKHTITNECGATQTITLGIIVNCVNLDCGCTVSNAFNIDASETSMFYNPAMNGTLYSDLEAQFNYDQDDDGVLDYTEHQGCIAINGRLIMDRSLTIAGANMLMQPCSEIFINKVNTTAYPTLRLESNAITSCIQMWKGITVGDQCRLEMIGGSIADAEFAVRAPGSSPFSVGSTSIQVENVQFIKNHVGIYLGESGVKRKITHLPLVNNTFIGWVPGQSLLPPCDPNLANYSSYIGYVGIVAQGLSTLNVGVPVGAGYSNYFNGIRNGIISESTTSYVYRSSFEQIAGGFLWPTDSPLPSYSLSSSIGIVTTGRSATIMHCKFADSGLGIYGVSNTNIRIQNNVFNDVAYGIITFGAKGFSILDNVGMTFARTAIIARELSPWPTGGLSTYNISRNSGTKGEYPGLVLNITGKVPAILVSNGNPLLLPAQSRVSDNVFKNMGLGTAGIEIHGVGGWTIDENEIGGFGSSSHGIWLDGSSSNYLYHNTISDAWATAFRIVGSTGNKFCCNIAENTTHGMDFLGGCGNTVIRNTDFSGTLETSVVCNAGTFISPQPDKGNSFSILSGTAQHLGSLIDIQSSQFRVLNSQITNYPPTINAPNQSPLFPWFVTGGLNPKCGESGDTECKVPDPVPPDIRISIDETDRAIANGDFYGNEYGDMQQWEGERQLYAILMEEPELLENDVLLSGFYTDKESGDIGTYYEAEKAIRTVGEIPSTAAMELRGLYNDIEELTNSLAAAWEELEMATTEADTRLLLMSISVRIAERDEVNNKVNVILNSLDSLRNVKLQFAKALNVVLPSENILMENRKTVNRVYLETLAKGITELTPQQFSSISAIAHQCILEGGNAVLDARVLYQMQEEKLFFDDLYCNTTDARSEINPLVPLAPGSVILVVPNPANNVLQITDLSDNVTLKHVVTFFDINGKQVMETEFTGQHAAIVISNLQNGVYTCRIEGGNGFISAQKVVIIH